MAISEKLFAILKSKASIEYVDAQVIEAGTDKTYVHMQIAASSSWEITHGLAKGVSVTVVDTGGNMVMGDIIVVDLNSIVINFASPFSGKAYIN